MLIVDIITGLPSVLLDFVDFGQVVCAGVVLVAVGFIGSLVSSRNI